MWPSSPRATKPESLTRMYNVIKVVEWGARGPCSRGRSGGAERHPTIGRPQPGRQGGSGNYQSCRSLSLAGLPRQRGTMSGFFGAIALAGSGCGSPPGTLQWAMGL